MKIIKEFKNDEKVYRNYNSDSVQKYHIEELELVVDFQDIINTQFSGGNTNSKFEKIKNFLHLGMYSKAPCGGFINFYEIKSNW